MANLSNINGKFVVEQTTGYVGVGTTDPNYPIEVLNASAEIALNASGGSIYRVQSDSASNFIIRKEGVGDRLVINSAGNSTFAGSVTANTGSKITSSSADTTFSIETTSGTTIFPILDFVSSHSTAGTRIRVDGTDVISIDKSQNSTFAGSVTITGGTTSGLNITTSGTQDTININRAANNDNAITKYQTASADKWIVGLRNTGDDKFRFYSYGTSSDVLTINQADGSVGIGTDSPGALLEISGIRENQIRLTSRDITAAVDEIIGGVEFYSSDTGNEGVKASISAIAADAAGSAYMTFSTGANTERMRIDSDGLVVLKSMSANTTRNLVFEGDSNSTSGNAGAIGMFADGARLTSNYYYSGGQAKYVAGNGQAAINLQTGTTAATTFMSFGVNPPADAAGVTERMRIDSNGVIQLTSGINGYLNTNSIGMEMDINRNPETGAFKDAGLSHARIIMRGDTTANGGSNIKFVTSPTVNTVGATKMTILGNGNVGIGETSPERRLVLDGTFGTASLEIKQNSDRIIYFGTGSSADNVDQPLLLLYDAGVIKVNISSIADSYFNGGNVGIGDTTPSFPLVVSKSSSSTSNGADLSMRLGLNNPDQTNNNWALITFGDGTTQPGSGFMGMQFTDHTNNYGELSFGTRGSGGYGERMRITSDGSLKVPSVHSQSTSIGANVVVLSDGELLRSTSSLKYKTDVRDYDKGLNEVMQLQPKYYKGINDGDTQFAGLIAEDVHDLGLTEFVQYADDGTPDALSYSHMIALLTKSIQELKADNDSLKARIETLENN